MSAIFDLSSKITFSVIVRFYEMRYDFTSVITLPVMATGQKKTIVTPRIQHAREIKSKSRIVRTILTRLNVSFEQMYIIRAMLPI